MNYEQSKRGYANMWAKAELRPDRRAAAQSVARRLNTNRIRYGEVSRTIPWYWTAVVHNLESGGNFSTHLHNGDPLTAKTKHVPAGRPATGTPPFTWQESAQDALKLKGLQTITDWNVARCLYEWERYNGFGYVARKINSPYVWSFTNHYARGKYVADGKFDAMAVSQQCGAAATLKAMVELKFVTIAAPVLTDQQKQAINIDKPVPPIVKSPYSPPEWDIIGAFINFVKGLFS